MADNCHYITMALMGVSAGGCVVCLGADGQCNQAAYTEEAVDKALSSLCLLWPKHGHFAITIAKKNTLGWGVFYAASSASPQGAELVGHDFLAPAGQVTQTAT